MNPIERREFLRLMGLSGLAAASIQATELVLPYFASPNSLEKIASEYTIENPYGKEYASLEVQINLPFPKDAKDIETLLPSVYQAKELGCTSLRVFLGDKIEPKLGQYHIQVLYRILELADHIPVFVEMVDGYSIFHARVRTGLYPAGTLSSPYATPEDPLKFFNNQRLLKAYSKRVELVQQSLGSHENILGFGIGNELHPPLAHMRSLKPEEQDRARAQMTAWYKEVASLFDANKIITVGTAKKDLLHESFYAQFPYILPTTHAYTPQEEVRGPVFLQETGLPHHLANKKIPQELHDVLLSRFLEARMLELLKIDKKNRVVHLKSPGIGIWRLDHPGAHKDGFAIDLVKLPLTVQTLAQWKRLYN